MDKKNHSSIKKERNAVPLLGAAEEAKKNRKITKITKSISSSSLFTPSNLSFLSLSQLFVDVAAGGVADDVV